MLVPHYLYVMPQIIGQVVPHYLHVFISFSSVPNSETISWSLRKIKTALYLFIYLLLLMNSTGKFNMRTVKVGLL